MKVAHRGLLLLAVLTISMILTGCSDENNQFIQGTWDRSDVHILDYWVFSGTTYLHKSGLHLNNPRVQSGSYYVAESEEGRLVIELIPEQNNLGFSVEPYDLLINIDSDSDSIKIMGKTYQRALP